MGTGYVNNADLICWIAHLLVMLASCFLGGPCVHFLKNSQREKYSYQKSLFKVILYSYLILNRMNERITDS